MARVLVVDDEPDIARFIEETLRLGGHSVTTASDGEEAITKIKRRPFDVVILDIMMPGTDGYTVLERIREMKTRASTRVIVVTAKHDPDGVMREMDGGADDHLAKPFLPAELEAAVERVLNAPDASRARRRSVASDAEVYGSMSELFREARTSSEAGPEDD